MQILCLPSVCLSLSVCLSVCLSLSLSLPPPSLFLSPSYSFDYKNVSLSFSVKTYHLYAETIFSDMFLIECPFDKMSSDFMVRLSEQEEIKGKNVLDF